jgi:hypothetical protein
MDKKIKELLKEIYLILNHHSKLIHPEDNFQIKINYINNKINIILKEEE